MGQMPGFAIVVVDLFATMVRTGMQDTAKGILQASGYRPQSGQLRPIWAINVSRGVEKVLEGLG